VVENVLHSGRARCFLIRTDRFTQSGERSYLLLLFGGSSAVQCARIPDQIKMLIFDAETR